MKTIWKYKITWRAIEVASRTSDAVVLDMPIGARIVNFAVQAGDPSCLCLWAIVDDQHEKEQRHFMVVGTGHALPDQFDFVATTLDDPFVWHLFERLLIPIPV